MLKIIDFKHTTNHCVLTYEWNDKKDIIHTGANVFDTKEIAYSYWRTCCLDYLKQQVDRINFTLGSINQTPPNWVTNFWKLDDKEIIDIDLNKLTVKTGDLNIIETFNTIKTNCKFAFLELKKLQNV